MNLRILIVDDEALSRERMRQFLKTEPGTEIIGECASGKEAVSAIRRESPDVVFLDVRMPELDGFGVLEELDGARKPAVIFVTAYDQFALQAFEIHAVDYLLKPFDRRRFRTALRRARERLRHAEQQTHEPPRNSPNSPTPNRRTFECIPIKSSGRIRLLRTSEIDWVAAADNYAELHVGSATHLLRMTITDLADRLGGARFVRISRSTLVNLDRVTEMHSKSHGDYQILLRDGTCLSGSRKYRNSLARLLGKSL